jgi:glycosyltransferase involved in cell wall biosynthesis
LNIVHIITGLSTGGAEKALYNILQSGLDRNFDNYVISLGDEGTLGAKIRALDVPVITLNMRRGRPSISGFVQLRKAIRKIDPDLIQGWMYHGNLAATIACRLAPRRPPLLWNIRQSLYDMYAEKLLTRQIIRMNRYLSSSPNAIIYNSYLSRDQHESFGISAKNAVVIPNGIDLKQFCFSKESRIRVRMELNIPKDGSVVGHVARFHPMKDHSTFLQAALELAKRIPDTHFILCGSGVSFDNKSIEQQVPLQVRNRFHLIEERGDVHDLMSAMDLFCQSSYSEAFPNVICEAMATSLPCIATDVGDTKRIVGDTGTLVQPKDVNGLADGLENLLKKTSEEICSLGKKARVRIESNYDLSSMITQYLKLYTHAIAAKATT